VLNEYSAGQLAVIKNSILTQIKIHVHEERHRIINRDDDDDDDDDNNNNNLCHGSPFQPLHPLSLLFIVIV
jgi:hypothetical protein